MRERFTNGFKANVNKISHLILTSIHHSSVGSQYFSEIMPVLGTCAINIRQVPSLFSYWCLLKTLF